MAHGLSHLWGVLLPVYLLAVATMDSLEVTNREYSQFVMATGHPSPDYWINGRYPAGTEKEPVVLVTWHDAVSYCRWAGRRLPTVDEWMSSCEGDRLKTLGHVWEWTSTDVKIGEQTFKALCGPGGFCDCSHRYLPEWKNEVKGFRCVRDSMPVTWLPRFLMQAGFL